MMMALTAGADVPDCHRRGGNGCAGYACSGYGHGCAGVGAGYGCSGSYGCHGGRRHFGRRHGGHGCSGYGCAGYGYGCSGYGCAGYVCGGAIGGCHGGSGTIIVVPDKGKGKKGGSTLPPPSPGKGKTGTGEGVTTGTIIVNLPEGARLTVDGAPTNSTASSRVLFTPNLEPGYEYYYTLRAEVVRDGQTAAQTQRIAVRSGEETRVSFDFATTTVVSNR
jgi:uncharacterized protein (TIGR03000 family)